MPDFEIYYRDPEGALVEKFSVRCATPMQAKIMSHAMKARAFTQIEIWQDDTLVYQRPEAAETASRQVA